MLNRPGDLIPVTEEAKLMSWTNRSSKIVEYLHRGPVSFSTLVYDTNVGDIATISSYFNPEMVTLEELNKKYAKRSSKMGEAVQVMEKEVQQAPMVLLNPTIHTNLPAKGSLGTPWPPSNSHLMAFNEGSRMKNLRNNDNLDTVMAGVWNQVGNPSS